MAISEADKRATKKYRREKMKSYSFRISRIYDAELIEYFDGVPDKAQWFRRKIREEMEGKK